MRWLLLLLFVTALVPAAPAAAAGTMQGRPVAVCIRPDAPGLSAASLFARPTGFDCRTPQPRFGSGDFWVISQPLPPQAGGHGLSVRFASLWQRATTLHILYADGATRRIGFTSATATDHLLLGNIMSVVVPHHDAPPVRLLWHVRGAANLRGVVLGAALADHGATAEREIVLAGLYGGFIGMGLALVIYNLALWGALRQRYQLSYCALVVILIGYTAFASGAAGMVFPSLDNNDRLRIAWVLLGCSATAVLVFARDFFEREVFAGWLGRIGNVVAALVVGTSFLTAAVAPWHVQPFDRLVSIAYLLLLALVPAILWRAWSVRSNYLWIFALAWGAPIVFACVRLAATIGLVRWSFWVEQSTIMSMAAEATVTSLGIAYRILLLSRDRDRARAGESEARLLADTDPLTGILNRRAFLARAIGTPGERMLMIVDLDHFKRVNDTLGHDGGDEVLRIVARTLVDAAPQALVARLGGEEFAITGVPHAMPAPADLLDRLRSVPLPFDFTVTASIGSCTGPLRHEGDWTLLYRRADEALFTAKAAGRDRARQAPPVPVPA